MRHLHHALPALLAVVACGDGATDTTDDGPPLGDPHDLTVNDVSVLLPIDAPAALWPVSSTGVGGPLLPRAVFDDIARSLIKGLDGADAEYAALRVVAARVDPCFVHNWGGVMCQPQLRLVAQALGDGDDAAAFDGALHLIYNLDSDAFAAVVADLRALTAYAPEQAIAAPLQVSPSLVAQGVDGPYGDGLRDLVLAHVGAANLARVTFMTRTEARAGQWEFGGRAVQAYPDTGFGEPGPLEITAIGSELQTVNQDGAIDFAFVVDPAFAEDVAVPAASAADLAALPPASQADVHDWAMRIERPTSTTPDSTDCASCHIAPHARAALETLDPTLLSAAEAAELAPRASGTEDGNLDNLRAFGWFGSEPVVSQRVANESAYALAGIASMYP